MSPAAPSERLPDHRRPRALRPVPPGPEHRGRPLEKSDEDLLEAFYEGDENAIESLIGRFSWLNAYALSMVPYSARGRAQEAEDIVQMAWIKTMDTRNKPRSRWVRDMGPVSSWLRVIVANCARDAGRKQKRAPVSLCEQPEAADPHHDELLAECERRAIVFAGLAKLPATHQEVVVLKYWAGMTQVQIARVLRVSEATVSRRWEVSAAALRRHVSEAWGEEEWRASEGW